MPVLRRSGRRPNCDPPATAPASPDPHQCTSLDLHETNRKSPAWDLEGSYDRPRDEFAVPPLIREEAIFRHSGWHPDRQRVWTALLANHTSKNRLDRFCNCGSAAYVHYHPDQKALRIAANYCHDRFCLPCGQARSRVIAASLADHCARRQVRFITLTLRHSRTPLADQIDRLYRSFRLLRLRPAFRNRVAGGAAMLELKWIPATRMWHPHLHILAETAWMPQKELSELWHAITGDSYIVDIRPIRDQKELTSYVTKYASKPMESSVLRDHTALCECIANLAGRRLCLTFGTWRGLILEPKIAPDAGWIAIGSLRQLFADVAAGDPHAAAVLQALTRNARDPAYVYHPPRPPPPRRPSPAQWSLFTGSPTC